MVNRIYLPPQGFLIPRRDPNGVAHMDTEEVDGLLIAARSSPVDSVENERASPYDYTNGHVNRAGEHHKSSWLGVNGGGAT